MKSFLIIIITILITLGIYQKGITDGKQEITNQLTTTGKYQLPGKYLLCTIREETLTPPACYKGKTL